MPPRAGTSAVEHELEIEARPETVFEYFTDPAKMVAWMGLSAVLDPRPGGTCRVEINPNARMSGEYVLVEPYSRLVFSWGWENAMLEVPPASTIVEVTLEPLEDGTRLQLVHRELPPGARDFHTNGWGYYLERLVMVARGEDPGADRFAGSPPN